MTDKEREDISIYIEHNHNILSNFDDKDIEIILLKQEKDKLKEIIRSLMWVEDTLPHWDDPDEDSPFERARQALKK